MILKIGVDIISSNQLTSTQVHTIKVSDDESITDSAQLVAHFLIKGSESTVRHAHQIPGPQ
ncbi:hypothetical protein VNF293_35030 [Atlantibacter hermannii]